jgi:outer membrane protein assembly factor BamB
MVSMAEPDVSGDHTVALDRRTGAVRWHTPLILAAIDRTRGHVVLTEYLATGVGGGPPPARIAVVDAATGTSLWGYVRDGACQADVPYTVDRADTGVGVLCQDGTLTVVDLGDGRVRARTEVRSAGRAVVLAGLVVVDSVSGNGTLLSAYDGTTLALLWSATVEQGNYGIADCGPRICLGNATSELALDRRTGVLAWQFSAVNFATPLSERYILVAPVRLSNVELVDVTSGRSLMQLDSWTVEPGSLSPLMLYQSDGATGRTWIGRLEPGSAAVEVLGFVPDARAETCVSSGGYVVCRTVNSTVGVWRYRT